jgi:DNA-binding PucR family transcriptional regulator
VSTDQAALALSPATRALAERTDVEPFVDIVMDALLKNLWGHHASDRALIAALRHSARDNATTLLALFAGRMQMEDIGPPAGFSFTDLAVQVGIPVGEIEMAYWVSSRGVWRRWFEIALEATAAGEGSIEEFIGPPTEILIQYVVDIVKIVVARYETVSEFNRRSRSDRQRLLVNRVLEDELLGPVEEIELELGYRFAGTHLGLALHATQRPLAEQLIAHAAERLDADGSLLTQHGADLWLGWLHFAAPPPSSRQAAIRETFDHPEVSVCAGTAGSGIEGFRQSSGEAFAAAKLRRRLDGPNQFFWYQDVSLELCLLGDEPRARRFMQTELGDLNMSGERAERARQTLLTFLASGSISQTASQLFLHENTVRARVGQAQRMLAADLRGRRAEVLVALRLRALLGDPD